MNNKIICPYCGKKAVWCKNEEVYGRNYGKSYMIYLCRDCDAYVGCHCNTKKPLGTMANKELRKWRSKTHAVLDPIWRNCSHKKRMTRRSNLYRKLNKHFKKEVHVGESDIEMCKQIIQFLLKSFYPLTNSK